MTEPKTKDHPKSERPPAPVRPPKDTDRGGSTDEGNDRASQRGEREFDPNVNQPPRR